MKRRLKKSFLCSVFPILCFVLTEQRIGLIVQNELTFQVLNG